MKKIIAIISMLSVGCGANAQITNIPDPIFEQNLIDKEIDSDGVVNGQMATADALGVTTLTITSPDHGIYINDLTGIEAFTDLESLSVNVTMIEELNVSTLTKLKYLDCMENRLTTLDVSNNPLLEHLKLSAMSDLTPVYLIKEIDLSNNPQIHTLYAVGIRYINLQNGNNNTNMNIEMSVGDWAVLPEENIGHVCIEVDDEAAAQADQLPYSEWILSHANRSYSMVATCDLNSEEFNHDRISVYPNPVSQLLYINATNGSDIDNAVLYDMSGRMVKKSTNITEGISVSHLAKGVYILQVSSGKTLHTQKIIVE